MYLRYLKLSEVSCATSDKTIDRELTPVSCWKPSAGLQLSGVCLFLQHGASQSLLSPDQESVRLPVASPIWESSSSVAMTTLHLDYSVFKGELYLCSFLRVLQDPEELI